MFHIFKQILRFHIRISVLSASILNPRKYGGRVGFTIIRTVFALFSLVVLLDTVRSSLKLRVVSMRLYILLFIVLHLPRNEICHRNHQQRTQAATR